MPASIDNAAPSIARPSRSKIVMRMVCLSPGASGPLGMSVATYRPVDDPWGPRPKSPDAGRLAPVSRISAIVGPHAVKVAAAAKTTPSAVSRRIDPAEAGFHVPTDFPIRCDAFIALLLLGL